MDTLRKAFSLPVGFSDHTQGIAVTLAAVARGASLIEKHFTLDRDMQGPDHQASIEPAELQALVKGTREIEMALGKSSKMPSQSELENRVIARKSIVASRKINTGERFSEENMTCKRPGEGISPMFYWEICGLMARSIIEKDDFIKL